MKKLLFLPLFMAAISLCAVDDTILKSPTGTFFLNDKTGAISRIVDSQARTVLNGSLNRYITMSKAGDVTLFEAQDKVVSVKKSDGKVTFICQNPALPELEIAKEYSIVNHGLRRTLTYTNNGKVKRYILTMTDMNFDKEFKQDVWHLGAGYIGPYKPLPHVYIERPVNEYKQSSKGMVLINPDGKQGNFSHYRVKINDTVVLPWWHSTIGNYREYADRLYYTPRGYRMGLGTLDVLPDGGKISVTDCFNCFEGNLFNFFDEIFAVDPDIAAEYKTIPKSPAWVKDVLLNAPMNQADFVRYLTEMTGEGIIIPMTQPFNDWADYRPKNGFIGYDGGEITPEEFLAFRKVYADISPRVQPGAYHIVVAAGWNTDIFREHPEWFRKFDRNGNDGSLFPGLCLNYQSMFNNAGLRDYFVKMLLDFQSFSGNTTIYLDEAQMTNTIDWHRDQLTRDDHTVLFWKELKKHSHDRNVALFYNGSGHPYADLNYMESPHDMRSDRWRDFAGIVFGLGLVNRMTPDRRLIPLYWSGKTDYRNRVMALGWIPSASYSSTTDIPTIRNVWQTGNTLPLNVSYTPDWKVDAAIEIESHAVQRSESNDVMLSFINRNKKTTDIPVTVDLATLQLKGRINIWKISYSDNFFKHVLSDNELKNIYRLHCWSDLSALSRPQLVYSGNAEGIFKDTIRALGRDKMTTYLFTAAPAAFYSLDDLVQNNFYTVTRHGTVKGKTVTLDTVGEVLLIDLDNEFYNVSCNGKAADTSIVDINGVSGLRVKLAPGTHQLDWQMRPRSAVRAGVPQVKIKLNDITTPDNSIITVERDGISIYTGKTPVTLPEQRVAGVYKVRYPGSKQSAQLRIFGGEGSRIPKTYYLFQPERKFLEKVDVKHGSARITARATYVSRFEDVTGMQRNLDPAVTIADAEKATLVAGTSRRDGINIHMSSFAGLELVGARQLNLRLSHTFMDVNSLDFGHVKKGAGAPETNFAGMLLDYKVNGKYVKRVAITFGLYNAQYNRVDPFWGKGAKPDLVLELGDIINTVREKEFSLDLQRFAPPGWQGELFLTLGTARVLPNHRLKLEIVEFNNPAAKNFIHPEIPVAAGSRVKPEPLASKQLKSKPTSLKKIDVEEWKSWARFGRLQPYGFDPKTILRSRTEAFIAHDFEYIYIGARCYEPARKPIAQRSDVCDNERIEFFMERADKKLFQVAVDTNGTNGIYINSMESALEGVISHAEYTPGVGTDIFMAIPLGLLKFNMQVTPNTFRCNLYRVRLGAQREYTVWAPINQGFNQKSRYSNIIFNFD